jgi:hypothetical protein
LCDNTQYSNETSIHAASGIKTRNPRNERPKTHALDRAATEIGAIKLNDVKTENTTNKLHRVTSGDGFFSGFVSKSLVVRSQKAVPWLHYFHPYFVSPSYVISLKSPSHSVDTNVESDNLR